MLNELLFRRAPWSDRLARIAQVAGDLLGEHGIYCLVGAFRVDDGTSSRLLVELRGDLGSLDPAFVNSLKALLLHGLNKQLQLDLKAPSMVLAISGEDVTYLPSLKAASINVLNRRPGTAAAPAAAGVQEAKPSAEAATEITEFGESGWTLFARTVAVTPSSSRFGELS